MNNQKQGALVLGMGQPAYYLDSEESSAPSDGEDNRDETVVLREAKISPSMMDATPWTGKHLVIAKEWFMDDLGDIVFIGRSLHLSSDDISPFVRAHSDDGESYTIGAHYDYYVDTEVFEKIKASVNGIFSR